MTELVGHANQWFAAGLSALLDAPRATSRGRAHRELLHVVTRVPDARRRVLTVPWRRANPFFQIAETVWLLAGSADAAWILRYNQRLHAYLDPSATAFHGAYGARLRRSFGRDQLADVFAQLQQDPGSRRAAVVLRDPARDNPDTPTLDQCCNIAATYTLRDGLLHAATFNRSNDYVLGLTFTNIAQFTTVQEFLASALGVTAGGYTHFSTSLHVYDGDLVAMRLLSRADDPYRFDVYDYVKPIEMRPWRDKQEGWQAINALYDGLPLPASACPYWRSVGAMLGAWEELQSGNLDGAVKSVAAQPADDWAIAGLEFLHRWARRRHREAEFDQAMDDYADNRWPSAVYDYIVHDLAP